MGVDKALLELDGIPLVVRTARIAAAVCGTVSLVGEPAKYGHLSFSVIPDEFPGIGPLAGIEAALRVTTADWNLILACDMPAIQPALLESLFPAACDVALPAYPDGSVEPLCGVYHRRCHSHILKAIDSGIRKVTNALDGLAIRYVPVVNPEPFTNLNTPDDVRRYRHG
jgi:molybdopterin-guanine dinucleotide biosynthesis protein A